MFVSVNPETTIYPNEFKLPCKAEAVIPFVFDEYIMDLLLLGTGELISAAPPQMRACQASIEVGRPLFIVVV